ncbi:MAG TPA: class I SAM-dependent methyltransferase [Vicinamibacteria bacterium]|nr:class I SAM-dependent methyltransferase [Vicinamibacteria bacterium]
MSPLAAPGVSGAPEAGPPAPDLETASEGYARRFAGDVGAWFLEQQARLTLALLEKWPRARVLDVGGGHGQLTGPLVEAGFDVTVYGSSNEARGAALRPWLEGGRARFLAGRLDRLDIPDRAFDVVLSYRLLPHVEPWRELVGELCRAAASAVLVDYPTRRSLNAVAAPLFALKRSVEGNTRPFGVFADAEVRAAFESSGFVATAREPEFVLPMALHRAAGLAPLSRALEGAASALGLRRVLGSPVVLRAERRG